MTEQISFTKYENRVLPGLREKLNRAESTEDVRKFFYYTTKELLDQALETPPELEHEDVNLEPDRSPGYRLSARLRSSEAFKSAWEGSDLPNVLARLAEPACKRYRHLEKSPEKTDAKIRR